MTWKNLGLFLGLVVGLGMVGGTWAAGEMAVQDQGARGAGSEKRGRTYILEPFYVLSGQGDRVYLERVLVKIDDYGSEVLAQAGADPSRLRALVYEVLRSRRFCGEIKEELAARLGGKDPKDVGVVVELTRSRLLHP